MVNKRLDPLLQFSKGLSGLAVILYVVSVICGLVWMSGEMFQRFGSFSVAVLILIFGLYRVVLEQISDAFRGKGEGVAEFEKKVGPVLFSDNKGWLNYMTENGMPLEERLLTRKEAQEEFDDFKSKSLFVLGSNELIIAAFATLQWGYGDMFHCWVHGKGFTTC